MYIRRTAERDVIGAGPTRASGGLESIRAPFPLRIGTVVISGRRAPFVRSLAGGIGLGPPLSLAAIAFITFSETPVFIIASVETGRRSKSIFGAVTISRNSSASLTPDWASIIIR